MCFNIIVCLGGIIMQIKSIQAVIGKKRAKIMHF